MLRVGSHLIVLLLYLIMIGSNFTANEFEEEFNSNVSSAMYVDFDDDGSFDFDLEDDEDSKRASSKIPMTHLIPSELLWVSENIITSPFSLVYLTLDYPGFPLSIYHPPKA